MSGIWFGRVLSWWSRIFLGLSVVALCYEVGATTEICRVRSTTVAARWGLFTGFGAVRGRVVASTFHTPRRMSTVPGTMAKALAGEALGRTGSFERFDGNLEIEQAV